jgi:glucosamine-6-phosphate deaminase
MKLVVVPDYVALSAVSADFVARELERLPDLILLAATGNTPQGAYAQLARKRQAGELDCSRLIVAQLDEYLDIGCDDRRSLYGWMSRVLLEPLAIAPNNVITFDLDGADPDEACSDYERTIRARGGFDLALLGLGPNGHLGFNEPPAGPAAITRPVSLAAASVQSNSRYWGSPAQVPTRATTVGMDLIMAARKTLVVVSGAHKSGVLRRMAAGEIGDDLPASHLRNAPDVTVIADRDAWPWDDDALPADDVSLIRLASDQLDLGSGISGRQLF